jgi:hypothetical protein
MERETKECSEFAYEALRDARDTIRATDFKANALLVVLAIAGASVDKIAGAERYLLAHSVGCGNTTWLAFGSLGAFAWLVALGGTCLVLAGKYNPIGRIKKAQHATGIFFGARAFPMSIWWLPFLPLSTPASLSSHQKAMELDEEAVRREVYFEHLKLIYIRDTKSLRLRASFLAGFASFFILCTVWICAVFAGYGAPAGS